MNFASLQSVTELSFDVFGRQRIESSHLNQPWFQVVIDDDVIPDGK